MLNLRINSGINPGISKLIIETTNKSMKAMVSKIKVPNINPMDDDPDKNHLTKRTIICILLGLPIFFYIKLYYGRKCAIANN